MIADEHFAISETLRATNAAESRFRVQHPNSRRRAVGIVALGRRSAEAIDDMAHQAADRARFFMALGADSTDSAPRFATFDGAAIDCEALARAVDVVILVGHSDDGDNGAAQAVVEACASSHVSLLAILLSDEEGAQGDLRPGLARLRPFMQMLIVTRQPDYLDSLLTAFGV